MIGATCKYFIFQRMASRPKAFGLTAEVNAKIAKKYEIPREQEALRWIEAVRLCFIFVCTCSFLVLVYIDFVLLH